MDKRANQFGIRHALEAMTLLAVGAAVSRAGLELLLIYATMVLGYLGVRAHRAGKSKNAPAFWATWALAFINVVPLYAQFHYSNVSRGHRAHHQAQMELYSFRQQLSVFFLDLGRFPSDAEGLDALEKCPPDLANSRRWNGPYWIDRVIPVDPYGNPYRYRRSEEKVIVSSNGPDGLPDTDDDLQIAFGN